MPKRLTVGQLKKRCNEEVNHLRAMKSDKARKLRAKGRQGDIPTWNANYDKRIMATYARYTDRMSKASRR